MAAHEDDQDEGSIPLLETEPSSREPIFRKRRAQRTSPLRFTLATALLVLGGLAAFYVWTHGQPAYSTYSKARKPHHKQVHVPSGTVVKETELVRPMFGRAREGGVVKFDLVASIYFRGGRSAGDQDATQAVTGERSNSSSANLTAVAAVSNLTSSQAYFTDLGRPSLRPKGKKNRPEVWTPPRELEWQRVFSEPVMRGLDVSSSGNAVVKVVLPWNVVRSICATSSWGASLEAGFTLVPSSPILPYSLANTTDYRHLAGAKLRWEHSGHPKGLPLPYPAVGRNGTEQKDVDQPWESRIQGTPTHNLVHRRMSGGDMFMSNEDEDDDDTEDDTDDDTDGLDDMDDMLEEKESDANATDTERPSRGLRFLNRYNNMLLVKRSMVTLIDRSPVYSLRKFRRKMRALKTTQDKCDDRGWFRKCERTFTNKGHFENLMRMASTELASSTTNETDASRTAGWRYPPFLIAKYGQSGPKDMVNLTEISVKRNGSDVEFDWHVSFAPISPVKSALAEAYYRDATYGYVSFRQFFGSNSALTYEEATEQDLAELRSAVMGHRTSPNARPIFRVVLLNIAKLASLISLVLTAYFWYSRILTTGISLPAHAIDTLVRFVAFGAGVVQRGDKRDWMMSPVVVLISALVWSLCARLEWVSGGPKEMVLVGVRRRRATKGERVSAREDGKFTWLMWGGLVASAFIFTAVLLPMLPPIMTESLPTPSPSKLLAFLTPIVQVSSIQLLASQLHLNHRLSKFGANYRLVPFLDLASAVLFTLPVLLSAWWGRWETMPAFGWAELCWVVGKTALLWQAWMYPRCEQMEDEER